MTYNFDRIKIFFLNFSFPSNCIVWYLHPLNASLNVHFHTIRQIKSSKISLLPNHHGNIWIFSSGIPAVVLQQWEVIIWPPEMPAIIICIRRPLLNMVQVGKSFFSVLDVFLWTSISWIFFPGSSQTFQSRSTLHSLKGVESVVAGRGTLISRQMSNRDFSRENDSRMSNNNISNDQRILTNNPAESQMDLKSFTTLKSIDHSDYGFLDPGRFQNSPKVNVNYLLTYVLVLRTIPPCFCTWKIIVNRSNIGISTTFTSSFQKIENSKI